MKIEILELKGWVYAKNTDDKDIHLTKEKPPEDKDEYFYACGESVGEEIINHFSKVTKTFIPSYDDWTKGECIYYKDVFLHYYVTDTEMTWDQALEGHVRKMAGDLNADHIYTGYSEYTITDDWVEVMIGGHDIRKELSTYEGKYVLLRIEYKVK